MGKLFVLCGVQVGALPGSLRELLGVTVDCSAFFTLVNSVFSHVVMSIMKYLKSNVKYYINTV